MKSSLSIKLQTTVYELKVIPSENKARQAELEDAL